MGNCNAKWNGIKKASPTRTLPKKYLYYRRIKIVNFQKPFALNIQPKTRKKEGEGQKKGRTNEIFSLLISQFAMIKPKQDTIYKI